MNLRKMICEYVNAAFAGIWIESFEHDDAIQEIGLLCNNEGWNWATWDIARGLQPSGVPMKDDSPDPIAAIKALDAMRPIDQSKAGLLILRNFHKFLDNPEIIQSLENAIFRGKNQKTFVIILSPVVNLPIELQKQFVVIEHKLPDREEMTQVLMGVATEPSDLPAEGIERILDASAGLTRQEAEGAFALSLVRHSVVNPETMWEIKSAMLKKSGLLQLHKGKELFDSLGGMDNLKRFCSRALTMKHTNKYARSKGVMLLGVPGSGKSAFAKALGNEVQRPTITLDIGALMGSLVGETEKNTRQALSIVDAMAPCIVFVDEIEKSLAGTSGGAGDSGVGARMFGSLLTWLNDHETDVFFIATSNDISKLPPEFTRAERFDGIFFIDLPTRQQKDTIWDLYENMFEVGRVLSGSKGIAERPDDTNWTGAEIRACCRLSAMMGILLVDAATNIVPVAITAGEKIENLREWAGGRCLSSEVPGLFTTDTARTTSVGKATRNVKKPGNN